MAKQEFQVGDEVKVGNSDHKMSVESYDAATDSYECMWFEGKNRTRRSEVLKAALLQPANVTRMSADSLPTVTNFTIVGGQVRPIRH